MAAGIFGYLGYDMVRLMEELPRSNSDPIGIPDAALVGPLPNRALSHPEVLRRLAERQPVGLADGRKATSGVFARHAPANLPKARSF